MGLAKAKYGAYLYMTVGMHELYRQQVITGQKPVNHVKTRVRKKVRKNKRRKYGNRSMG